MEILIGNQNKSFFLSILLGLFIGIIYDCLKLIRNLLIPQKSLKKHLKKLKGNISTQSYKMTKNVPKISEKVIVMMFDLLFCFLISPIFCIFTYITLNGHFRWFIFAAAFLGAIIYKGTFGRLFGIVIDYISYFFHFLCRHALNKIKIPLEKISGNIKRKRETKRKKREEEKDKNKRTVLFSYGKSQIR